MKADNEFFDTKAGDVLSSINNPIPVSNLFTCEIVTLELEFPILKGLHVLLHING